jgi:hypothetical protein
VTGGPLWSYGEVESGGGRRLPNVGRSERQRVVVGDGWPMALTEAATGEGIVVCHGDHDVSPSL